MCFEYSCQLSSGILFSQLINLLANCFCIIISWFPAVWYCGTILKNGSNRIILTMWLGSETLAVSEISVTSAPLHLFMCNPLPAPFFQLLLSYSPSFTYSVTVVLSTWCLCSSPRRVANTRKVFFHSQMEISCSSPATTVPDEPDFNSKTKRSIASSGMICRTWRRSWCFHPKAVVCCFCCWFLCTHVR